MQVRTMLVRSIGYHKWSEALHTMHRYRMNEVLVESRPVYNTSPPPHFMDQDINKVESVWVFALLKYPDDTIKEVTANLDKEFAFSALPPLFAHLRNNVDEHLRTNTVTFPPHWTHPSDGPEEYQQGVGLSDVLERQRSEPVPLVDHFLQRL